MIPILKVVNSSNKLFVENDANMFKEIHRLNVSEKLQVDLENIFNWSKFNGMLLNLDKCINILFSLFINKRLYYRTIF